MSLLSKLDYVIEHDVCHTKAGLAVMTFLRKTRISRTVRKRIVFWMMDRGTYSYPGDRGETARFFSDNRERADRITGWLADEKSRKVYLGAIRFRTSLDRKDLPACEPESSQYFDPVVQLRDDEVFVDCGAYIGDTVEQFLKRARGRYRGIVCFEPDPQNYQMLKNKKIPRLTPVNAGVWREDAVLFLEGDQATASRIVADGSGSAASVQVRAIDSVPACADATFLKMDIEGAELDALQGAERTILKNRPKLAICIYHSDEDMLRIPEYIHGLAPDYKLYVRHYSYEPYETVLYAVPG